MPVRSRGRGCYQWGATGRSTAGPGQGRRQSAKGERRTRTGIVYTSPSDDPQKWAAYDSSLQDTLRGVQKSSLFKGYELHWIPHKSGDATIVAIDEDKVIGSLFYGKERPTDKTLKGAIEVRPEYRRQGIATALYIWAEELSGLKFLPDEPHTDAARALWGQKDRRFGLRERQGSSLEGLVAAAERKYPLANGLVDGRLVRRDVPNLSSIDGYFADQEELPGIREVPVSDFGGPRSVFYASDDFKRSERLADAIAESGEIAPLIIGFDEKGPFIIEGAHRFVALHNLKARSFPAVVVVGVD